MQWMPHATVAAIVEDNGKFLLVEEITDRGNRFNQPAGHLEDNETLIDAVIRETLEETAYHFEPVSLLGIYHWKHAHNNSTYLRFAYIGKVSQHQPKLALDEGIIRTVWMSAQEMRDNAMLLRSPQVLTCVEDYLNGQRFPLAVVTHLPKT
ncbi:MAG: NUDIX hydrolase [Betaproteobacteria bacterium HGW-Betaproteobacteria-22]|nr:MAG: NUDIX hydrolase [Betaproteobacteria bacterium HGW-Betaproteobacteria-22]